MQAEACSIRSRLRRSHGWLCSIRSRLRRSHSALLIHCKKVELKSDALPPQHTGQSTSLKTNVVYIINCVWAAVCRNVVHPGIQSAVDGERLGLRRYKTNFMFPEDGRFISSKFDMDPCIHGEDPLDQKNADGRMDRRTAFQLYIVEDIYI